MDLTDGKGEGHASTGRALVVGAYLRGPISERRGEADRSAEARLDEAAGLALAIDLDVVDRISAPLAAIKPGTFLGSGKVEEIGIRIEAEEIGLVVMDCALSPVQQRNLERAWKAKVLDRTGLILEIFGRRALTKEGRLQVELAHLTYQKSRLVRSWTHLERQRGGHGFLGGPGETQIEADRRAIQERISKIERELEGVRRTRSLHRSSRRQVPYAIVALVGYTNAGKSTLFNRLTRSEVMAEDLLFATLDPTLRLVALPHGAKAILSDTVGFISDLPTDLVAAFRATLEEVVEADVILHVRDVAHEDSAAQAEDVRSVLAMLGLAEHGDRIIEVWNKADLLDEEAKAILSARAARERDRHAVLVSAATGEGSEALLDAVERRIAKDRRVMRLVLDPGDGSGLNWLYETCEVLSREDGEDGFAVTVRVPPERTGTIARRFRVGGTQNGEAAAE